MERCISNGWKRPNNSKARSGLTLHFYIYLLGKIKSNQYFPILRLEVDGILENCFHEIIIVIIKFPCVVCIKYIDFRRGKLKNSIEAWNDHHSREIFVVQSAYIHIGYVITICQNRQILEIDWDVTSPSYIFFFFLSRDDNQERSNYFERDENS